MMQCLCLQKAALLALRSLVYGGICHSEGQCACHASMLGSTFGSSTNAAHGSRGDISMMVRSVVCTVQSLETTVERMDHSLPNPYISTCRPIDAMVFPCLNSKL